MIDDILGLLMLAIVTGIVVSGGVDLASILVVLSGRAVPWQRLFLRPLLAAFTHPAGQALDLIEAKMFISYLFVMVLAWLANLVRAGHHHRRLHRGRDPA